MANGNPVWAEQVGLRRRDMATFIFDPLSFGLWAVILLHGHQRIGNHTQHPVFAAVEQCQPESRFSGLSGVQRPAKTTKKKKKKKKTVTR